MSTSPVEYLKHILDESIFILRSREEVTVENFLSNEILKRAIIRSLEVIGEAPKKIPDSFRAKYPQIEWKAIAGMRDKLIHDYFGVDYELVWDVIPTKIPTLKVELEKIITAEQ